MRINYVIFGLIIGIVLINGCTQQSSGGLRAAPSDIITVEATIVSLTRIDNCPLEEEECSVETNPDDFGEIRIDKIIDYERHPDADYEPLTEGEYRVDFSYSTRPAKVRCMTIGTAKSGGSEEQSTEKGEVPKSSVDGASKSIQREEGYLIFTYGTGQCPPEKILPGLKEGEKIRFTMFYRDTVSVGEYGIIT